MELKVIPQLPQDKCTSDCFSDAKMQIPELEEGLGDCDPAPCSQVSCIFGEWNRLSFICPHRLNLSSSFSNMWVPQPHLWRKAQTCLPGVHPEPRQKQLSKWIETRLRYFLVDMAHGKL